MSKIEFDAYYSVHDISAVNGDNIDITYTINVTMKTGNNIETFCNDYKMSHVTLAYSEILCLRLILASIKKQYRSSRLVIHTNNNRIIEMIQDDNINLNYYERQQMTKLKQWMQYYTLLQIV